MKTFCRNSMSFVCDSLDVGHFNWVLENFYSSTT